MRKGYSFNWALIIGVCLVYMSGMSIAATDVELYRSTVVVSLNANNSEQADAIEKAFTTTLVKVSGLKTVVENPEIAKSLKLGERYLSSFRFIESSQFFTNVLGEKIPTKAMVLDFDQKLINDLLVANRLPVWGVKRPEVLVWMADRINNQDHILADSEESHLANTLLAEANLRGIPIVLPIMDLSDTLNISFADVYGLFSTDIEYASTRYEPEAILAGRLSKSNDKYQADWLMLFKGERLRLPTVTGTLTEVTESGIDLVAQRLSEQYAFVLDPNQLGNVSVKIEDVSNAKTFAAIERYLKSINMITKLKVLSIAESTIIFDVEISGDRNQFSDLLSLDKKLVPLLESTLEAQLDNELLFRWQP
ncbi:DUF2066 domain-containing protein [Reinekea sp.]|jgi:hypothetical protein|uniref:DUF2066 domain-containing protein n=1 Tax=Reinekea sp. TaxID=1970455 RepID=UPI003989A102